MDFDESEDLLLIAELERIESEYSKKDKHETNLRIQEDLQLLCKDAVVPSRAVIQDISNKSKPVGKGKPGCESTENILKWLKPVQSDDNSPRAPKKVIVEPFTNTSVEILVVPSSPELRKYQRDIILTAVMHNTLVCLPTGLGKTLIAAVVMYNFLRWFPDKCVVFMAPTRPLVHQQLQVRSTEPQVAPRRRTARGNHAVARRPAQPLWESRRTSRRR